MTDDLLQKGKVRLGNDAMEVWYQIYPESEGVTAGRFEYYNPPPQGIHAALKSGGTLTLIAGRDTREIEITEPVTTSRKTKFYVKPHGQHILNTPPL
jgi:hypothetical protein